MGDETPTSGSTTWHFFVRRDEPELWCAVPAERSIPRFIISGAWRFGGHRRLPPGFSMATAEQSDLLNGFYLFHRLPGQTPASPELLQRA